MAEVALRVLETERLALRWLDAADAGFVLELVNDPDWLRYIGDRGIRSIDAAREYIDGLSAMYARLGFGLYLVELKGTDTALGICGLIKRNWLEDVDLGFAFLARFRGNGYACEAASATLDYAETEMGLRRVAAIVSPENQDSRRLLARLGMQFERTVHPPLDPNAVRLYACTRPDSTAEAPC